MGLGRGSREGVGSGETRLVQVLLIAEVGVPERG